MNTLNLQVPDDFQEWNEYEKVSKILELLNEKFPVIGEGTTRRIYDFSDDLVLKCPLHPSAIDCNVGEQNIYNEESYWNEKYCYCKTIIFYDVPLLLMEKVTPYEFESGFTWEDDWRDDITEIQVGLTKDGKIKAFDFCQF